MGLYSMSDKRLIKSRFNILVPINDNKINSILSCKRVFRIFKE